MTREWVREDPETPSSLRELPSPSVPVNGQDVGCGGGSIAAADANACRIYADDCGCIRGAPSVELILRTVSRQRSYHERAG